MQKKRLQKSGKRKKRHIRIRRKKKEKKKKNTHSLHLNSKKKKKYSFQLAYSSIGIGNRLSVFIDLHFRFVFYFLFLCLFRLLHGLLLECWPCWVFVLSFLLNFSLVILVLFTGTTLHFTPFLFVLLNFYFFRFSLECYGMV